MPMDTEEELKAVYRAVTSGRLAPSTYIYSTGQYNTYGRSTADDGRSERPRLDGKICHAIWNIFDTLKRGLTGNRIKHWRGSGFS